MFKVLKIFIFCYFICFAFFSCKRDHLSGNVEETRPPILQTIHQALNENSVGFYIGMPYQYQYSFKKDIKYPLIVCFPGAGGYGSDDAAFQRVLSYGIPKLLSEGKFPPSFSSGNTKYSFIILAPHFINPPSNDNIKDFITFAKNSYPIDSSRIYLVGVSVGGRMACDYAAEYPNEIAALVNTAGCADVDIETKSQVMVNSQLPVWAFHNRADEAWPIASQINFIATINNLNPVIPARLTIFEISEGDKNHDAWTRASDPGYKEDNKNIYEWMLQYNR